MEQIGIFGGTFDPPHVGHLTIAQTALIELHLDKVVFMPCGNPPHKPGKKITSVHHRLAMVQAAVQDNEKFIVSDFEAVSSGPSYTAKTLSYLKNQNPETNLLFIVGADSLADMKNWWHPEQIFSLCSVAVAVRKGTDLRALSEVIAELEIQFHAEIVKLDMPMLDISSSLIRNAAELEKMRYLLPPSTLAYIRKHHLYQEELADGIAGNTASTGNDFE